ncbi:alcohol dehydrogenase [Dichomitus squalens]|uniref:Alcohol dehydrogenase n=1 Tax=Dichomitus squalens TaxID=114155 RepID=A0A4Q9MG60_9APHY|nr:alcohol dehydrogenase [Dichomitus squalens]
MSGTQRVVRWYPPAYDIRVEDAPIPQIIDDDDAIVKVILAGLCGSDLHIYRGHEDVDRDLICGHEIVGEVVALGSSFCPDSIGRPELYSTLKVGDKVVSPFTVSCGECHFCRIGFTCRCKHSCLLGIPALPGGQAQYIRIPKAGGTLFSLNSHHVSSSRPVPDLSTLSDSSLLLLADILPTGAFAAIQALQHPKVAPILIGAKYPFGGFVAHRVTARDQTSVGLQAEDRILTIGIVGLGPVGICATVSLLDMLSGLAESQGLVYQIIAIDPLESRRSKMEAVYDTIHSGEKAWTGRFAVASIDDGKKLSAEWTDGAGCNAVLEVVGNNNALTLSYEIVRPFGIISSVGVHQEPPLPFNGRGVYDKNVSFDFGRCPVRAMFPIAVDILLKRQDVFGSVGEKASLIDKIVPLNEAPDAYEDFDKGRCGKILFDPWR